MSDIMDRLLDTTDRDAVSDAREEIAALRAENSSLSAWQCVYTDGKTGLVGDEHGNQYCAMAKRVEALRAEVERLTGERDRQYDQNAEQIIRIAALEAENERLREALLEIVKPGGADGFWGCVDIARAALEEK